MVDDHQTVDEIKLELLTHSSPVQCATPTRRTADHLRFSDLSASVVDLRFTVIVSLNQ